MKDKTHSMSDHDLLITLHTKFDRMENDIKSLSDGTAIRLAKVETRIDNLETLITEIDPKEKLQRFYAIEDWAKGFKITWRIILSIISLASLIIGAILGSFNVFDFLLRR